MLTEYFEIELQTPQQQDLGWQNLLVPLERTVEVMSLVKSDICPIPGVHSALEGVVNQRGRLIWVLDLPNLLGWKAVNPGRTVPEKLTTIVLKGKKAPTDAKLAGVVTALKGIVSLDSKRVLPLPTTAQDASPETPFLQGMATVDAATFAVLDVDAVFQSLQTSVVTTQTLKA